MYSHALQGIAKSITADHEFLRSVRRSLQKQTLEFRLQAPIRWDCSGILSEAQSSRVQHTLTYTVHYITHNRPRGPTPSLHVQL